ncbi:MAG: HupE/UreJ family protein [Myxococcota bacterium]
MSRSLLPLVLSRWVGVLVLVLVGLTSTSAHAHEFRPGVLTVRETEPGQFVWSWQPPFDDKRQPLIEVQPRFSEHCTVGPPDRLECGGDGLGDVVIEGLRRHPVDTVVRVHWSDGRRVTEVLHGERDRVSLTEDTAGQSDAAIGLTYAVIGVEHILIGIDHVLFVLGLLMLVGWGRRLLWAITGFTLAHSVTLAMSTLGVAALAQGPVEVSIALSIVLLARELTHEHRTLTRRLPGLVAFGFGLLHGFGFAGALQEVGIPPDRAWLALLGFNLGVEAGQLAIILVAAGVGRLARRLPKPERLRLAAAYLGGSVAMAWTIERMVALVA